MRKMKKMSRNVFLALFLAVFMAVTLVLPVYADPAFFNGTWGARWTLSDDPEGLYTVERLTFNGSSGTWLRREYLGGVLDHAIEMAMSNITYTIGDDHVITITYDIVTTIIFPEDEARTLDPFFGASSRFRRVDANHFDLVRGYQDSIRIRFVRGDGLFENGDIDANGDNNQNGGGNGNNNGGNEGNNQNNGGGGGGGGCNAGLGMFGALALIMTLWAMRRKKAA